MNKEDRNLIFIGICTAIISNMIKRNHKNREKTLKIKYLNPQRFKSELNEYKEAYIQIENKKKKFISELNIKNKKFSSLNYDYIKNSGSMNLEERKEKEKEILEFNQKGNNFKKNMEEEIVKYQDKILNKISSKIKIIIQQYGKKNGIDYILNIETGSIIYAAHDNDITDHILYAVHENDITDDIVYILKNK